MSARAPHLANRTACAPGGYLGSLGGVSGASRFKPRVFVRVLSAVVAALTSAQPNQHMGQGELKCPGPCATMILLMST